MLLAETIADRQWTLLIVVGIVTVLLMLAYVTVRLLSFLSDRDDDGVWVMALEPAKHAGEWETPFDCAVRAERICGAEYLLLIWPRSEFDALETEMSYDTGITYQGERGISAALKKADTYWNRPRIWSWYPPIRRRLQRQYQTFREIANFALERDLILMLVMLEPIDDCDPLGVDYGAD